MKVPTIAEAEKLLSEAEQRNQRIEGSMRMKKSKGMIVK